ncbi:MAG: YfhO family protein [Nitrospinales bacterium]
MLKRIISPDIAAVFFLFVLALEYFSPVLFQDKTFFLRDIPLAAYPMKHFLSAAYHAGEWPFWNPALFSGMPFMATLHPGAFYPPSLIFFLDDFTAAFNLYFVLHHLFFAFSVYALVRYWGLSAEAALGSAITAFWGGYFLSVMNFYNHFQSAVWMPLILLFFQKYLEKGQVRDFLATVACLTCQTLAGSPENSVMTVLLVYGYSIIMAPAKTRISGIPRRTLILGGVTLLSLGLAAIQLLPTYALIKESVRNVGMDFADHAKWSLQPYSVGTLLLPESFSSFMEIRPRMADTFFLSVYMGVFPVAFLCLGLTVLKERAIRFWIGVFFVGLFLALGKYNPLYESLYQGFPLLHSFRYPEKFFFLSAFSLVFLVGHGLDALPRLASRKNFLLAFGTLLLLSIAIGLMPQRSSGSDPFLSIGLLLMFGFCLWMFHLKKLGAAGFKILFLLLALSDLVWKHYMLAPLIDKSYFEDEPRLVQETKKEKNSYRVFSGPMTGPYAPTGFSPAPNLMWSHIILKERLRPNLGMIYGIHYADGLAGVELNDISLWVQIFKKSPPEKRRRILERSNVKYWISAKEYTGHPEDIPRLTETAVEELENALPRAFLVPEARLGEDPKLLNTYYGKDFDPRAAVLIGEPVTWERSERFEGAVVEAEYRINRVTIRSRQSGEGFLVLLDAWFPGWEVKVDGKPGRILRGNHFYRAVKLGSGEHITEFFYEPVGFKAGVTISLTTLLIIFGGVLWYAMRAKPTTSSTLEPPKHEETK